MKRNVPTFAYNFKSCTHKLSSEYKEKKDCTVRALGTILDSYKEAHEILRLAGRKSRKGFYFHSFMSKRKSLGKYKIKSLSFDYLSLGQEKMTPARFCYKYSRGKYIVSIKDHVFAVVDGVVYDHIKVRPGTRVFNAWQFYEN